MKNYVGKKIRGFRFEYGTDGLGWGKHMEAYIGKVGEVLRQRDDYYVVVEFDNDNSLYDNAFTYPISLIEPHLIEDENSDDTPLVKCGECNKHYRCTTCDADCGTDGHYVEKEPHSIEEETPEIPQLGEGIEMEVSDDGIHWDVYNIIARLADGRFIDSEGNIWKLARPIPQIPKYTHAELVEKLGHDFEYINK